MIQEKIDELLAYCKVNEYTVRSSSPYEGLTKIQISNKYLQKINLKIVDNHKLRLQNTENNRFSKEIENIVQKLSVDMLPHYYDVIIYTNKFHYYDQMPVYQKAKLMILNDVVSLGVPEELESIVSALESVDCYDEIKIYTSHKGIVSVMQDCCQIKNKYPNTPYEAIYNLIKEKHLLAHFEWIKKTGRTIYKKNPEQISVVQPKTKHALVK